eukprot:g47124.t1
MTRDIEGLVKKKKEEYVREEIVMPLAEIFVSSAAMGEVPEDWRVANVVPFLKKSCKEKLGNYRPGSVLGSLLLFIYMNDLDENLGSIVSKFADDIKIDGIVDIEEDRVVKKAFSMLAFIGQSFDYGSQDVKLHLYTMLVRPLWSIRPPDQEGDMVAQLVNMGQWTEEGQMEFNLDKCEVLRFGKANQAVLIHLMVIHVFLQDYITYLNFMIDRFWRVRRSDMEWSTYLEYSATMRPVLSSATRGLVEPQYVVTLDVCILRVDMLPDATTHKSGHHILSPFIESFVHGLPAETVHPRRPDDVEDGLGDCSGVGSGNGPDLCHHLQVTCPDGKGDKGSISPFLKEQDLSLASIYFGSRGWFKLVALMLLHADSRP